MNDPMYRSELRAAAQRLARTPGFAAVVLALLSLALAAVLTLAAAASSLLLQPLPYPQGERLVEVRGWSATMGNSLGFAPGLLDPLQALPQVEAVVVYDHAPPLSGERGELLASVRVGEGLLELLGAQPLHGRLLTAADAGSDAVLLSETAWRARFGADPGIVGQRVRFGSTELHIVGVVAAPFRFPQRGTAVFRWLEVGADARHGPESYGFGAVQALVRMAPGATTATLGEALRTHLEPLPGLAPMREFMRLRLQVVPLRERWTAGRGEALALVGAAVAVVLLLLAANLAGLWLERSLRRRREFAVRAALGASNPRIVAGVLAEIALLCTLGLAIGASLVQPGLRSLEWLGLLDPGMPWTAAFDLRLLALAALLLAALVGALALAPMAVVRRVGPADLGSASRALGGSRGERARRALVALQVGLAVALLAGGVLLSASMWRLLGEDIGFAPEGLVMATVDGRSGDPAMVAVSLRELYQRAASLPGVGAASFSSAAPFSGSEEVSSFWRPSQPEATLAARGRMVGADYLRTLQVPVLRGRGFVATDAGAGEPLVVVDALFAGRAFGDSDPVGARLSLATGDGSTSELARVIGVAATVRHNSLDEAPDLGTVYRVVDAPAGSRPTLLLRTVGATAATAAALRAAAADLGVTVTDVRSLRSVLRDSVSDRVPMLVLLLGFAGCGMALSMLGLFALVAFSVERRRGEFGLRLAVGASPAALRRLALRDALRTLAPGLAAGLLGALLAGRVLAARLHGTSPYDPLLLAGVLVAVAACLLSASLWPAWRAARVDPSLSLRCE